MVSTLISFLTALLTSIAPHGLPPAPVRAAMLPESTRTAIAEIDHRLGKMRMTEGERPGETKYTAWYDGADLRKIAVAEFNEAYYLKGGALFYARRQNGPKHEEAVFEGGKLVQAFADGSPVAGDAETWQKAVSDARATLADEEAFAKKPMSETGVRWEWQEEARRQLDAEAAAIDAAKGTTVTKSVRGMSTDGAELTGLSIGGELRRVTFRIFGESYRATETYYLRGGQPFLYVREHFDYTIPMTMLRSRIGGYDQARYYLFAEQGGIDTGNTVDRERLQRYIQLLARPETEFGPKDLNSTAAKKGQ